MPTEDLIDYSAAAAILGVGKTTVAYLAEERNALGTVYRVPAPRGRHRVERYLSRAKVEELAAGDWRKRKPRTPKTAPGE